MQAMAMSSPTLPLPAALLVGAPPASQCIVVLPCLKQVVLCHILPTNFSNIQDACVPLQHCSRQKSTHQCVPSCLAQLHQSAASTAWWRSSSSSI